MTHKPCVYLRVCVTCRAQNLPADLDVIAQALGAADLPVEIVEQACMNACSAPVSMALQAQGRATCFFTGVDLVSDCDDIVATVREYLAAPEGWITDARPCGRLRFCLAGRVPVLPGA